MKRIAIFLLAFFYIFLYTEDISLAEVPPSTAARGAVLMDAATGRVLFAKNPHVKMPMASTTKIMTAILAIEKGKLTDIVTTSRNAAGIEGSSIWLAKGEKMTLENLLYGLMLSSGNDAAMAIAEHIGGNVDAFVEMMNQKALEIGATNTHFANPHGLHDSQHYTTAYDLALISCYAMRNPIFRKYVSTKYKEIPWEGHQWDRVLKNKNKILWQYEGGNGIKTGYTTVSGRCLAAAALRSDMQLVCVVLNCHPWFEDSMGILDYGFKEFKQYTVFMSGQCISNTPVINGIEATVPLIIQKDIVLPIREGEEGKIKIVHHLPEKLEAPIVAGTRVGNIEVHLGDEITIKEGVYTALDVEENTYLYNLKKIIEKWNWIFRWNSAK